MQVFTSIDTKVSGTYFLYNTIGLNHLILFKQDES